MRELPDMRIIEFKENIFTLKTRVASVINIMILCLVMLINPAVTFADGTIFPDTPELSNPLNTGFNYNITSSLNGAGEVLSRPNNYTYRPAVMKITDQQVYMWFCSGDGHGDGIYFASSSNSGQTWGSPVEVVKSSATRPDYLDYSHACDPSVVSDNSYYYVFYTGSTDWGANSCRKTDGTIDARGNCDNRIFVARVPVSSPSVATSYQKLVDVGECSSPSCFQYQPFWGPGDPNNTPDYYPPVPVVRNETVPVWRLPGTGPSGNAIQQTPYYGIGQPSALNVYAIRIWYTMITGITNNAIAEWIQWRPYQDLSNPFALQDQQTNNRRVSNRGNDVDYNVAYDTVRNRYITTIARNPLQPCVNFSLKQGVDTSLPQGADPINPDNTNNELITRNLTTSSFPGGDNYAGCLSSAGAYSANDGFVRNVNGYLDTLPNPSGTPMYWVYYADNANQPSNNWHIARVPFTVN